MGCTGCSEEHCGEYGPDPGHPWRIECNGCSRSFASVAVAEQFRDHHRKRLGLSSPPARPLPGVVGGRKLRALIANRDPKSTRNRNRSIPGPIVEQLQHALESLGFEVTVLRDFGLIPFEEQVQKSQSADLLISPHGGQVTNCVFQKTGGVVIEIYPRKYYMVRALLSSVLTLVLVRSVTADAHG